MPGRPIIFRAIDFGYQEPTVIYQCVQNADGKWELVAEAELKQYTMDQISDYLKDVVAAHKPIVVPDDMPQQKHELKRRGFRVK